MASDSVEQTPEHPTCKTCRFYRLHAIDKDGVETGECRFNPPVADVYIGKFPRVIPKITWCGKHERIQGITMPDNPAKHF